MTAMSVIVVPKPIAITELSLIFRVMIEFEFLDFYSVA
ncbi:hypothetical protein CKA32_000943 [Geitlerinema sp. FC II]|nr:hypothetical protein CKA32_000943 [Geitlerinema sp. FC II]